jgi:cyclophilin family peptidyl-prolyl cis-trans isomerase
MSISPVRGLRIWLPVLLAVILALAACADDDGNDVVDEGSEPAATEQPEEPADTEEEQGMQQPSLQWDQPPAMQLEDGIDYKAVLNTNRGEIVIDLLQDEAPVTVNNFVFLAEQGFYQNVPFHRVISGFMIQTGDPTGTGAGGPGYRFDDEPVTRDYVPGTVAMANAGPNTNGSQFFIVHGDLRGRLPKDYTIFGEVTEGQDVVDQIANVQVQPSRTGEMSSPTEEVQINSVEIRKQ